MEYQILALDLDGTLTNSKKEISRPTLEALIDIQEQGKKVVLASGRPTKGVLPLAKQLHLEDYGSYILSFNGARITDCRSMQAIYNKTLPGDIVEPLLQILRKYDGLDILSYTADNILSGIKPNKYTELESRINHMPIIEMDDFAASIKEPANKCNRRTGDYCKSAEGSDGLFPLLPLHLLLRSVLPGDHASAGG